MENIGRKRRSFRWVAVWACSIAVLFGTCCYGQDELTYGEWLSKAGSALRVGNSLKAAGDHERAAQKYDEAIDAAYICFQMTDDSETGGVIKLVQEMRYKIIAILIDRDRLDEAATLLQEYIDRPIAAEPRNARRLLATCYYELGQFDACVKAVNNALRYNEDPSSKAGETPKDPSAKVIDYVKKYNPSQYEQPFSDETITTLHMTLAEAHFKLKQWNECLAPYEYVKEKTTNGQTKGYAIMQMINALVEIPDFERIAQWIPELYRTDARYDIRVNIALMNVATRLFNEGFYDEALPLYRMILPREELIAHQKKVLRKMRVEANLAPEDDMQISESERILFNIKDEPRSVEVDDEDLEDIEGMTPEIRELMDLIEKVQKLPPYEVENKYRMAQIYHNVERYWEAVKFFEIVYEADPESSMGEYAIHQIVRILLRDLKDVEKAEKHAFAYLKRFNKGLMPRQVAYEIAGYYQQADEMETLKGLLPYLDNLTRLDADPELSLEEFDKNFDPLADTSEMEDAEIFEYEKMKAKREQLERVRDFIPKYDSQLYYMMGIADLVVYNFVDAEVGFQRVLDEFPTCDQAHNALYWLGMTKLFQNKFKEGLDVFDAYPETYPNGEWKDESAYQGGLCLFGIAGEMEYPDYTAASNRFTYVIETYPNPTPGAPDFSSVYSDACSRRGDLYGASGEHDLAMKDYRTALERAEKASQATYAVFQLANIYKVLPVEDGTKSGDFEAIVRLCEEYLEQWGHDGADIAKALFWIGKSKMQQGKIDEAIADYVAAILEYGTDVTQEGVDLMIEELVKSAEFRLDEEKLVTLLDQLETAAEATESKVLALRLRSTMAMINKTETVFGRQLLETLEDFEDVPPPVLSIVCDVSIELEDYSRSEEILDIFRKSFEESQFIRTAYKLRGLAQMEAEDYDGALETVSEVQDLFSQESDMYWAQLMRADLLLAKDDFEAAYTNNLQVLGVPAWRGEPVAQAIYQMGQVREKQGLAATDSTERTRLLNEAFGYYQRVYFQFKGYSDGYWAAEAYLASARVMKALGRSNDERNSYIAMLYDRYVNELPQADVARKFLGHAKVAEIEIKMEAGATTNITISVERDEPKTATNETATAGTAEGEE